MRSSELLAAIRLRGACVFGTGYVAGLLHEALAARDAWSHVRCCVVTRDPHPAETFCGIPVRHVRDLTGGPLAGPVDARTPLVLVAVHEALLPQAMAALRGVGVGTDDAVWAYPVVQELLWGAPHTREAIAVADLLASQSPQDRWLAVRAAAARTLAGEVAHGDTAYLKAQALHCSAEAARARLERIPSLLASVRAAGLDPARPALVDERMRIIDGLHRIALAWYCDLPQVPCAIVAPSRTYDLRITERNRCTPAALDQAGLTKEERAAIERTHALMMRRTHAA